MVTYFQKKENVINILIKSFACDVLMIIKNGKSWIVVSCVITNSHVKTFFFFSHFAASFLPVLFLSFHSERCTGENEDAPHFYEPKTRDAST